MYEETGRRQHGLAVARQIMSSAGSGASDRTRVRTPGTADHKSGLCQAGKPVPTPIECATPRPTGKPEPRVSGPIGLESGYAMDEKGPSHAQSLENPKNVFLERHPEQDPTTVDGYHGRVVEHSGSLRNDSHEEKFDHPSGQCSNPVVHVILGPDIPEPKDADKSKMTICSHGLAGKNERASPLLKKSPRYGLIQDHRPIFCAERTEPIQPTPHEDARLKGGYCHAFSPKLGLHKPRDHSHDSEDADDRHSLWGLDILTPIDRSQHASSSLKTQLDELLSTQSLRQWKNNGYITHDDYGKLRDQVILITTRTDSDSEGLQYKGLTIMREQ
jgi:hypothetical protein